MKETVFLLTFLGLFGLCGVRADVKLPAIFGDHMVLQQEAKLPVWGWADQGEKVTVTFGTAKGEATAGADGKWRVDLPPVPAGTPPGTLVVTGKNTISLSDVLVGDVWICSGQSNMVYGLTHSYQGGEAAKAANFPRIRLFFVVKSGMAAPSHDVAEPPVDSPLQGKWQVCTPETIQKLGDFTDQSEGGFSAVGYFFARDIYQATQRPVGMIASYFGGTGADAWTSLSGLKKSPELAHYVQELDSPTPDQQFYYTIGWAEYVAAHKAWNEQYGKAYQDSLTQWNAAAAAAKAAGQPSPPRPPPPGAKPRNPNSIRAPPAALFNGMINPLVPYAIKGVVWYQGENNVGNAVEYRTLLSTLIQDWREQWGEGDFPFLIVQLPNNLTPPKSAGDKSNWALLREAQFKTLAQPNTGMAVTIDLGMASSLHPPDKVDVGARLALVARHVAYGENLVCSGPVFDSYKNEGNKLRIFFKADSIGGGLALGRSPWNDPQATRVSATELQGFAIAGEDENWVWPEATIDGNAVVVSSPQVVSPVAVRYAWADNPVCNLYNKEGLPAVPFRTDDWEEVSTPRISPSPTPSANK